MSKRAEELLAQVDKKIGISLKCNCEICRQAWGDALAPEEVKHEL